MLETHHQFFSFTSTVLPPHMKRFVLAPVLIFKALFTNTQSALIGQLTYAWASNAQYISSRLCHVFSFQVA